MSSTPKPPAARPAAAPPATISPTAAIDMPQALRQYIEQQNHIDLVNVADQELAWTAMLRGLEMQVTGAIITGYHAKRLKAQLSHGAYIAGLTERGIPRQTAHDAVQTYETFAALEKYSNVRALAHLGLTKGRALAELSEEQIEQLEQGQEVFGLTYQRATEMTVRELQEHLKAWRQAQDEDTQGLREDLARAQAERQTLAIKLHAAEQALQYRSGQDLPPWYHDVRIEAAACADTIDSSLTELEALARTPLLHDDADRDDEQLYLRQSAAGLIYHALAATTTRMTDMLRRIEEIYQVAVVGEVLSMHMFALDGDELKAATERRAAVLRQVELGRMMRQAAKPADVQAALTPRGRGRPKGAKNKGKA